MYIKSSKDIFNFLIICCTTFLIPCFVFPSSVDPHNTPRIIVWGTILIIFTVSLMIKNKLDIYSFDRNLLILVIFVLTVIISSIANDSYIFGANIISKYLLFTANIFIFIKILKSHSLNFKILVYSIVISSSIVSFLGIVQYISNSGLSLPGNLEASPYSTMGNKNYLATYLFTSLPFIGYALLISKGKYFLLCIISLITVLAGIIICECRAVFLAIMISGIITFLIAFILFQSNSPTFRKYKNLRLYILITSAIIIILPMCCKSKFGDGNILSRAIFSKMNEESTVQRFEMWDKSILLFFEYPFSGAGLNKWKIEFPKYGLEKMGENCQQGLINFNNPHNDFLWLASETGVLGLAGYSLILLFNIFICFRRILTTRNDPKLLLFNLITFGGVIGIIIFSLFDSPLDRVEFLVYSSILYSINIYNSLDTKEKVTSNIKLLIKRKYILYPLLVCLLTVLVIGTKNLLSEYHLDKARIAHSNNDQLLEIDEINKASSIFCRVDPATIPVRWYSGVAYYSLGNYPLAYREFMSANNIHPYNIQVMNNLAAVFIQFNQEDKAIELYKKALVISPRFEEALINLSIVYYNQGKYLKALEVISKCKLPINQNRVALLKNYFMNK